MKRKVYYVAPRTDCMRVAVEGSFASSVVQENPESGVTSTGHEINSIDGGAWNATGEAFDQNGWVQE